ncbi:heavy metal-associated isoprenylated plant protein 27 isoform X2 [Populus nigra]|uniref:Copper chaperone (CCH)-like family protein 7 n=1 Tax=Populus x xiaohei TaxID=591066 RepID=A0A2D3BH34_9ROSI|nr:heavy metal-associated isoprenylated plant protein 27 isoform X2 [Populus nigra]ATT59082.1 copper chaperone (CCH)-like family protein 7 [Populus simonii x Populus nigra]
MGCLDRVSELCHWPHDSTRLRKREPLETVEIKVKMDCEGCETKVRNSVTGMKGVIQVEVDRKLQKLTVTGYVDPDEVLHRVRYRTGKKAEFWPYVPAEVVPLPYSAGVYDKKAPPGYVRNPLQLEDPPASSSFEVKTTTAFSDDNPNACVIM